MLFALLALVACDPEGGDDDGTNPDDGDSGDTGGRRRTTTVTSYSGICADDGAYRGELRTTAETSGIALLNLWETGEDPGWNEEHDLIAIGSGTGGELLAVTLARGGYDTATTAEGDQPGVTAFGCRPGGAFLDSRALTYAIRTTDTHGNVTDCVAFGHRPECVASGDCGDAAGVVTRPDQLRNCRIE